MKTKGFGFHLILAAALTAAVFCMPAYAAAKTTVSISGLSAPQDRVYNWKPIDTSEFGTPSFDPSSYSGDLTYTFYEGSSVSGSAVSTPSDAGSYTVRVSVPDTDPGYTGYTDIPFTIAKADTELTDITFTKFSTEDKAYSYGYRYKTTVKLTDKPNGTLLVGLHFKISCPQYQNNTPYWVTTDTDGVAELWTEDLPAGSYTWTYDYTPFATPTEKNLNPSTAIVYLTVSQTSFKYSLTDPSTSGSTGSSSSSSSGSGSSSSGSYANSGTWILTRSKWQFKKSDGTIVKNSWFLTGGKWYHFDADGFAQTGWILDNGKWYHFNAETCAMDTGLYHDATDGHDYYLNPDGSMAVGWVQINDKSYYFNAEAAAATYTFDAASQTWIWNSESTNIPYGAMLKNTVTPDNHPVDENGARTD